MTETGAAGEPWRLIVTGPLSPAENMAADEALMQAGGPPTLRLYGWEPPALSLGYFQRISSVDSSLVEREGLGVVRRLTGGGAIVHRGELTFAITTDESKFPYIGTIDESYDRVHRAVASGLACLGVRARLRGEDRALASDQGEGDKPSFYCFYHSASPDLEAEGRKLLGSAQRRTGGRLLHHGSLPLEANPVTGAASSLEELLGRRVSFEEASGAFLRGFEQNLGLTFRAGRWTPTELALRQELIKKYRDDSFTGRR